jgi:hypothetical protein
MSDTAITFLRLSVSLLMFAVKGSQDGIVQPQIGTIGLRAWLSLLAVWIVERVCAEVGRFRNSIVQPFQSLRLKPVIAKINVPGRRSKKSLSIYLFQRSGALDKIEFNVLNPYLIVLAGLWLIFDRDEQRAQ